MSQMMAHVSKTESTDSTDDLILFKDMVTFKLPGNYKAILISRPKRYEIHLAPIPNKDITRPVECIASDALETVRGALDTVLKRLRDQYTSPDLTIYSLGFFCCCKGNSDEEQPHLMLIKNKVVKENVAKCHNAEDNADLCSKSTLLLLKHPLTSVDCTLSHTEYLITSERCFSVEG